MTKWFIVSIISLICSIIGTCVFVCTSNPIGIFVIIISLIITIVSAFMDDIMYMK